MRIPLGTWLAMTPAERVALDAYAYAHQNGLHIDLDDLGALNDRTPPFSWIGLDTDKRHEVENYVDLDVIVKHSGVIL